MDFNSQSLLLGDPPTEHSSQNANAVEPTHFGESLGRFVNTKMGPTPHVILTTSEITEQRLRKKIRKLIEQRDHWKKEYEDLKKILTLFPYSYARDRYEESKIRAEKFKRLSEYDTMVPLLVSENERLKAQVEALQKVADAIQHP